MADVRIIELPTEGSPTAAHELAIDLSETRKLTIGALGDVARPFASQAQAEAGTDNTTTMTPLTSSQQLAAKGPTLFASTGEGALAATALQPGDVSALAFKNKVGISDIDASGSTTSTTFLAGNGTWVFLPGGGNMLSSVYDPENVGNEVAFLATSVQNGDDIGRLSAFDDFTIPGPRVYGRVKDRLSLLDYATSRTIRTNLQNGNTSPSAVWLDAMDEISTTGARLLDLPDGNYSLDAGEALDNTTGARVRGLGSVSIRKFGEGSLFRVPTPKPDVSTGIPLAADAAAGTWSVTLETGGGAEFAEQTFCILISEAVLRTGNTAKTGEFVEIQSISGDTITFWKRLEHSYTVGGGAKLLNVNLQQGVGYENLEIFMDPNATVNNSNSFQEMFSLDLRWCLSPVIRNVTGRDGLHAFICLHGCVNTRISEISGFHYGSTTTGTGDPTASDGTPGFGYGIREDGLNTGLIANSLFFEAMRHGYTSVAGYTDAERLNYGWMSDTLIANGLHLNARNMGWDSHWSGSGLRWVNLKTIGGRYGGFQARATRMALENCHAENCTGPALWIRGGDGTSDNGALGNYGKYEIEAVRTNLGITYDDNIDWRERGAILDEAFGSTISKITASLCGGPALMIGRNGVARQGIYRSITARDICQSSTTTKSVVEIVNANTGANLVIDGLVSHSNDGKVVDLIHRATAATGDGVPIPVDMSNIQGYGHTGQTFASVTNDVGMVLRNSPKQIPNPTVRVFDDFTGVSLASWNLRPGSSGTNPAIAANPDGLVRLTAGANAAGTMATNGTQLDGQTIFRADSGNLVFEAKCRISGLADNVCFVGVTTSQALQMPFTIGAGDALTVNATNALGFLFDNAADTKNWWLVGSKASVGKKANSGIAPVSGTFYKLRFEISIAGTATFSINGVVVGQITDITTVTAAMALVGASFCRSTTASRIFDIAYLFAEQQRTS